MKKENLSLLKSVLGDSTKVVSSLLGGMMNEAYIVESNKTKYVFYIPTTQACEMVDRSLEEFASKEAERLSITRETIYFDIKKGLKISKYIEGDSLNHLNKIDYQKVARLLYSFHSSKNKAKKNYEPLKRLATFKKEAFSFTKGFPEDIEKMYEELLKEKDFLESFDLTLAHNDAQRSNIIVDEQNNYYLIDYEFAMNNDPIYDVASFGNDDVKDGLALLDEYLRLNPLLEAKKRYLLWRIDISLQWYFVALIKHFRGEGKTHKINFNEVAEHFRTNALEAYKMYLCH